MAENNQGLYLDDKDLADLRAAKVLHDNAMQGIQRAEAAGVDFGDAKARLQNDISVRDGLVTQFFPGKTY